MPNNDDRLTDLPQTPKGPKSRSSESDPDPVLAFLFALVALFIAVSFLFAAVKGRRVGIPIVAMVGYTLLVAFIAYNRVPWDRLTSGRFLLEHCLALAIVYVITTGALAAKPHLPTWFTTKSMALRGRTHVFSFFDLCLMAILFALAFYEVFGRLRPEDEEASEGE